VFQTRAVGLWDGLVILGLGVVAFAVMELEMRLSPRSFLSEA
jgi:hypothetical protein